MRDDLKYGPLADNTKTGKGINLLSGPRVARQSASIRYLNSSISQEVFHKEVIQTLCVCRYSICRKFSFHNFVLGGKKNVFKIKII